MYKNLSAGLFSNSEAEDDLRVIMNSGADTMSLTSAQWYYEAGDKGGQAQAATYDYPLSELPYAKVCIAEDMKTRRSTGRMPQLLIVTSSMFRMDQRM